MKKKRIKNIIIAVVCVLIFYGLLNIIPFVSDVNRDVFYQSIISLSFWIVVIVLIVNAILGTIHYITVKKQLKLLNEGKAQEALNNMKRMLLTLQSPRHIIAQNICKINISAAYCDLGQYGKMQEVLDSVDTDHLSKKIRAIYELNVCACYYYMGNIKIGNAVYEENKNLFEEYKSNRNFKDNIEVIEIFYLLANKNYDEAGEKFKKLKNSSKNPRLKNEFAFIENKLANQNPIES